LKTGFFVKRDTKFKLHEVYIIRPYSEYERRYVLLGPYYSLLAWYNIIRAYLASYFISITVCIVAVRNFGSRRCGTSSRLMTLFKSCSPLARLQLLLDLTRKQSLARSPFNVVTFFSIFYVCLMIVGFFRDRSDYHGMEHRAIHLAKEKNIFLDLGISFQDGISNRTVHLAKVKNIFLDSGISFQDGISNRTKPQSKSGYADVCMSFDSDFSWFHDMYYVRRNDLHGEHSTFSWSMFDSDFEVAGQSNYMSPYFFREMQQELRKTVESDAPLISMGNCTKMKASNVVMIQGWMQSYGHLVDSVTKLAGFFHCHDLGRLGFVAAMNIPPSQWSKHILDMARILFGEQQFINIDDVQPRSHLLKLEHVILVNNWMGRNFMMFPSNAIQMLHASWQAYIENITANTSWTMPRSRFPNIFLTRKHDGSHRLLRNFEANEKFLMARDFIIIEPEGLENMELFLLMSGAKNIVLTSGSARATLLTFASPTARVFILNSESYQTDFEKDIWREALSRFENVTYIESFQNEISEVQLLNIVHNLRD